MDSRQVFEKNVRALRKRSRKVADELEAATGEGVEEVEGPRGAVVLRERGVLLGSAYDPEREAKRLAQTMAKEPADIMVAVGFGLGQQFEAYCELNPGTVIVYEPSIERLRAALQRISIVNLLAKNRDFHIATDPDQFTNHLNARYFSGLRVRVFPHPAVLRLDPERVTEIVERTRRVKEATDSRVVTSVEMLMPWAGIVARNGRRIAQSAPMDALAGAFQGKPAVIVAAGPSLDKQLPLLREMKDRVLIIAIGQTLKALRGAGIEPDLVHILESSDVSHQLTDAGDTRDLCVALSPDCHHAIYDVSARAQFTATTSSSPMASWISRSVGNELLVIAGGTVAQGAVGLAVAMGANPVILIGQDLAFTDGRAYAKGSVYGMVGVSIGEDGDCAFTNMKQKGGLDEACDVEQCPDTYAMGDVVWVDGWNEGERLPTWRAYAAFIEQYRDIGQVMASAEIQLINCTEGGARIPRVLHRAFREVLEEVALESFDARGTIIEAFDAAPSRGRTDYEEPLAAARRALDQVEEEVEKARRFSKKKGGRLRDARNDQQRVEVLRGLARHEKRIRRQLLRMPWLDALVQPEIYNVIAASRRTERLDPSVDDLADEASYLIEAAGNGVERARRWFEGFEDSFDESPKESATTSAPAHRKTPTASAPVPPTLTPSTASPIPATVAARQPASDSMPPPPGVASPRP